MVRSYICERHSVGPALSRVEHVHVAFHAFRRKPRNQGLRVHECLIYGSTRRLDDARNASASLLAGLGRHGAALLANGTMHPRASICESPLATQSVIARAKSQIDCHERAIALRLQAIMA